MSLPLLPHDPRWVERYAAERSAVREALGDCLDGGVLFDIAHIGSSAVPGLPAQPCIDIVARVHPFPLPEAQAQALSDAGYREVEDALVDDGEPGRQLFERGAQQVRLQLVSFETDHWPRLLLLRNYLRENPEPRQRYERRKRELAARHLTPSAPDGLAAYLLERAPLLDRLEQEAFAWHVDITGFTPVIEVARDLRDLDFPWFVSSGWALDLFVGAPGRYHDDIDIVVDRDDQLALQRYLLARGWRLDEVVEGGVYRRWRQGELIELNNYQVHARKGERFIDLMFEPREEGRWVYSRDRAISLPLTAMGERDGIPYLAPEIVLLFKRRSSLSADGGPRVKDRADFERVLPHLEPQRRSWLLDILSNLHPDHPWCERLREAESN